MRLLPAILALVLTALLSVPAQAFGPHRFSGFNKHVAIAAYGRAVYPKYYGGFHAREFENLGLPHGDIGIVGNGGTRTPW
jgi:hypothetical protein